MLTRWFPWRFILRTLSRTHGFIDPIYLLTRFERFSKPAEIVAPGELMRAGALLHARGLINSQAIQHNLDWAWPYWVEQQFDPRSPSFVPRAFSITHINLTQRNWTAVGLPGLGFTPLVDARGLLMPFFDSWSVDFWMQDTGGQMLIPARLGQLEQTLDYTTGLGVRTTAQLGGLLVSWIVDMIVEDGAVYCRVLLSAQAQSGGRLIVALRPFNPEGVSFIEEVTALPAGRGWLVNNSDQLLWSVGADRMVFSCYEQGDVYHRLKVQQDLVRDCERVSCSIGMATAAAIYQLQPSCPRNLEVYIPLGKKRRQRSLPRGHESGSERWKHALENVCTVTLADTQKAQLFKAAVYTMVLHAPAEIYAGPYTYKRFWFRDAVLIANAMLSVGLGERVGRVIHCFPAKQTPLGYFLSQDGEWDSNGQVLWLLWRYQTITKQHLPREFLSVIRRAASWIQRKRLADHGAQELVKGLMPAGFSAEHLGPNDYYYWDDFWSVAGLRAAAALLGGYGEALFAELCQKQAESLWGSTLRSMAGVQDMLGTLALPTSPLRRLDSSAVGSLAASFPLQLLGADDACMYATAVYLVDNCLIDNALFHDISHSGINPYLTLHVAQVLLRHGDERGLVLMDAIAQLASTTGQWPEAIHPRLKSGCMGDGQHIWAAAEWVLMMIHCFVREERSSGQLILCSGVMRCWIGDRGCAIGPVHTCYGVVNLTITSIDNRAVVRCVGRWHGERPHMVVHFPWAQPQVLEQGEEQLAVSFAELPA